MANRGTCGRHPAHGFATEHFKVERYQTCDGPCDPCFHHANRITVGIKDTTRSIMLVRLAHPASQDDHRAEWLLGEPSFRELAQLK